MKNIFASIKRSKFEIFIAVIIFLIFSVWFYFISKLELDSSLRIRQIWGGTYTIMALLGGIIGIQVSNAWGGYKSLMGKVVLLFSISLFLQSFGQIFNSYHNIFLNVAVPYPSIGDIGFFGSVLICIYAVILLCRVSGAKFSFKLVRNKIWAFVIPILILVLSYFFFLNGYEFDWSNKLKVFLDFGYPLGQAIYISIAILALFLSKNYLGGVLKKPILFITFVLIFQYFCDFVFIYQVSKETWCTGCINDYQYFVSYFIMTLAIIYIGNTFKKIRSESSTASAIRPDGDVSVEKIFNRILVEIIKRQERVAGQIAWEEVKKVSGISIINQAECVVTLSGNPKDALDQLVRNYKNLFGNIAVEVSKNAVYYLIAELPKDQVPDSLS